MPSSNELQNRLTGNFCCLIPLIADRRRTASGKTYMAERGAGPPAASGPHSWMGKRKCFLFSW
jgi:hypothetical protein